MPNRTKRAGEPIFESKNVITGENPTRFVKAYYPNPSQYARERFLTDDEVVRLLIALDNYHDENMADVIRLCIYTGARHGEVRSMRWRLADRHLKTLKYAIKVLTHCNATRYHSRIQRQGRPESKSGQ